MRRGPLHYSDVRPRRTGKQCFSAENRLFPGKPRGFSGKTHRFSPVLRAKPACSCGGSQAAVTLPSPAGAPERNSVSGQTFLAATGFLRKSAARQALAAVTVRRYGAARANVPVKNTLPRNLRIPEEICGQASIGGGDSTPVQRRPQCAENYAQSSSKPQDSCGNLRRRQRTNGAAVRRYGAARANVRFTNTLPRNHRVPVENRVQASIGDFDSTRVRRRPQCAAWARFYQEAFLTPGNSPL